MSIGAKEKQGRIDNAERTTVPKDSIFLAHVNRMAVYAAIAFRLFPMPLAVVA